MTRLSRAGWVRFLHAPASTTLLALAFIAPTAGAQQRDTLRAPQPARIDTIPADSIVMPRSSVISTTADPDPSRPVSPGGAFLQSFVLPGRGQLTLGKKNAARFYIALEAVAIGMTVHSVRRLREAKRVARDSTVLEYTVNPATGDSVPSLWAASRFPPERIDARRTHVEDWVALIIFNHLLSAADAYVAANLWDFPTRVSVKARPGYGYTAGSVSRQQRMRLEATIAGSIAW